MVGDRAGRPPLALACELAGVEPTFTEYDGDDAGALALVISLNVQRRELVKEAKAWSGLGVRLGRGRGIQTKLPIRIPKNHHHL